MQNAKKVRYILIVFAFSNMAALIYQISWTKSLSYVFGTSVYAIGTVLACFMAGLAVGSFVLGKHADKSTNPVRLFAFVEIALGLYALFLIFLFTLLPQPYSFLHRIFDGTPFMNIMLFALSFQVLIIPTSLIGGMFPIMNRIYSRIDTIGRDVGNIYSLDTVFAGIGALVAGFVLLPLIGISMTTGFAALAAEVVWIRALSLTLGTSIFAISIITACFLIGLSLGSYIIGRYIPKFKNLLTFFAFIELGIGASGVLLLLMMENLDIPYLVLYHAFDSFYPFAAVLFLIIFIILSPQCLWARPCPL